MADAAAEQANLEGYAKNIFAQFKNKWTPIRDKQNLGAAQVMFGAAAILQKHYGNTWPQFCRLGFCPGEEESMRLAAQLPKPSLGFVVIHTGSHCVLLHADSQSSRCWVGGKGTICNVRSQLIGTGRTLLLQMGFPVQPGDCRKLPGLWQYDSGHWGWLLLHTMQRICEGSISFENHSSLPPLDLPPLDTAALATTTSFDVDVFSKRV